MEVIQNYFSKRFEYILSFTIVYFMGNLMKTNLTLFDWLNTISGLDSSGKRVDFTGRRFFLGVGGVSMNSPMGT